ncbi:SDR family NAD(P)-dependent oxidoreductase, partial [Acinetobacter baumannii]
SKGIGKAIANKFAAANATLLLCSRGEKSLYDTVEELQTQYPNALVKGKPADMAIREEVKAFAEWCLQQGTPDILINNAGQ